MTSPPVSCHEEEPPFPPAGDQLGRLWCPRPGVRFVEQLPSGIQPRGDESAWLITDPREWAEVIPPHGQMLARRFGKLDMFDYQAAEAFASRWGFLSRPTQLSPRLVGERWDDWFLAVNRVQVLLTLYDSAQILRSGEDARARAAIMDVLRAKRLPTGGSTYWGAHLRCGGMLFWEPKALPAGIGHVPPDRTALVDIAFRIVQHFLKLWGSKHIQIDVSPPPAPRFRPTFNTLLGALYLSIAEAMAGPRPRVRRCANCGRQMTFDRRTKLTCSDACRHQAMRGRESRRARDPVGRQDGA